MTENLVLLQALTRKMEWTEQRHAVIAQNIANADTSGYVAQDIKRIDFTDLLKNSASKLPMKAASLATTNPAHMTSSGQSASSPNAKAGANKNPYETSPTGNSVVLEEQAMLLGRNMSDHDTAAALYQKQIKALKDSTR